jgi:hypothetical protein
MINENTQQVAKYVADAGAYSAIIGTFLGYLPAIAAAFSIVWISIQIWESKTFNKFKAKLRRSASEQEPCPHGYEDWDICPDCRH